MRYVEIIPNLDDCLYVYEDGSSDIDIFNAVSVPVVGIMHEDVDPCNTDNKLYRVRIIPKLFTPKYNIRIGFSDSGEVFAIGFFENNSLLGSGIEYYNKDGENIHMEDEVDVIISIGSLECIRFLNPSNAVDKVFIEQLAYFHTNKDQNFRLN